MVNFLSKISSFIISHQRKNEGKEKENKIFMPVRPQNRFIVIQFKPRTLYYVYVYIYLFSFVHT